MSRRAAGRRARGRAAGAAALFVLGVAGGCAAPPGEGAQPPRWARPTGRFARADLTESSGVAVSRSQPGILWTINDGREPVLFATDTLGRDRGRFLVAGAAPRDWEELAAGPCGAVTCLYFADTGDNRERRATAVLYRVPEPRVAGTPPAEPVPTAPAERVEFAYPDGAADVEAMYIGPDGAATLVTKGRSRGVRAYQVPPDAWASPGRAAVQALGALPIQPDFQSEHLVTGAALGPDGTVVVRTYRDLHFFRRSADGALAAGDHPPCDITGLEPQGEAVDWLDGGTLVLTSERRRGAGGTITLVACP